MVGPIVYQEMLLGSRHGRWHWLRWLYAAWLLALVAALALVTLTEFSRRRPASLATLALLSGRFLDFFMPQHFLLLTLATPTLAAGAITDEKTRGTLQYLLTADLFSWELILGKLFGRLYQILTLALLGLPLFCFFGVFSGLGLVQVFGILICSLVLVFALGAASVLASVVCRQTRDAVLCVYLAGLAVFVVAGLVVAYLPGVDATWLERALELPNPLLPLGPRWAVLSAGEYLARLGMFSLLWGVVGVVCLTLAIARLRRACMRQLDGAAIVKKQRWWHAERPDIGAWPLAWKERHVEGVAPLALLRHIPARLGVLVIFLASMAVYGSLLLYFLPADTSLQRLWSLLLDGDWTDALSAIQRIRIPHALFWYKGLLIVLLAVLIVGIRCSGAVTREREQQTWEALLLTPLSTRQLIRGKLWGIVGACVPYLLAYAVPALVLSVIAGPAAFMWTLLWLGVLVLAVWYAGAAGLWCSVRAKSSWRSLLNTLAFLYLGGLILAFILLFFALILGAFLAALLSALRLDPVSAAAVTFPAMFGDMVLVALCLLLAVAFFLLSWRLLVDAEYRVSVTERTRHWKSEPIDPFRRGRRVKPEWETRDKEGRAY